MRLATIKLHGAEVAGIVTKKGILPVAALNAYKGTGWKEDMMSLMPASSKRMAVLSFSQSTVRRSSSAFRASFLQDAGMRGGVLPRARANSSRPAIITAPPTMITSVVFGGIKPRISVKKPSASRNTP